jgi:predicted nucleic-acid-binding protein
VKHVLLDTNVVLRFLRNDDPIQSPQAAALFEDAANGECALSIGWHVVAECVWALRHHYDAPRQGISNNLKKLIELEVIACADKSTVLDALERYGLTKLDIVDCMLAAESIASGELLATFDQGIGKQAAEIRQWKWHR